MKPVRKACQQQLERLSPRVAVLLVRSPSFLVPARSAGLTNFARPLPGSPTRRQRGLVDDAEELGHLNKRLCASYGRYGHPLPEGDNSYLQRQIGPTLEDQQEMLRDLELDNLDELVAQIIPTQILLKPNEQFRREGASGESSIPKSGLNEYAAAKLVTDLLNFNEAGWASFIGRGFHNTFTPYVIKNQVLNSPIWYSPYTPYQAEISQGRLEILHHFQSLTSTLTGLPCANAGLLDAASATVEAVQLAIRASTAPNSSKMVMVEDHVERQIVDVLRTRLDALGLQLCNFNLDDGLQDLKGLKSCVAVVMQTPDIRGLVTDVSDLSAATHALGAKLIAVTDPLALTIFDPPGRQGADIVVGSSQRLGIPMNMGGPAAAFFATKSELLRHMPGRVVGRTTDSKGAVVFRLALQTREQHIRRERATSNICTAQSLPAVMAAFYAIYHGARGLQNEASLIYQRTVQIAKFCRDVGLSVEGENRWLRDGMHFGIVSIRKRNMPTIMKRLKENKLNCWYDEENQSLRISVDSLLLEQDICQRLFKALATAATDLHLSSLPDLVFPLKPGMCRESEEDFQKSFPLPNIQSELEMMRYIHLMGRKDLGLQNSMIPLGSCTMKNNPAVAIDACLGQSALQGVHPLAPVDQNLGGYLIASSLCSFLADVTGFDSVSIQPNAGSVGEVAGLNAIRLYHASRNEEHRKVCLIPQSAHGTNFASAGLAGFEVCAVKTEDGKLSAKAVQKACDENTGRVACIMVTYPSTYGVFEDEIREVCEIIHASGGQVYIDGANMNAQLGLTSPAKIGGDVCHLNLHKTFGIPHGGGGPGVGPVCVRGHLRPFLPSHNFLAENATAHLSKIGLPVPPVSPRGPVQYSMAPLGSAGLSIIPFTFINLLGRDGLMRVGQTALLNANWLRHKCIQNGLAVHAQDQNRCGHEFILDLGKLLKGSGLNEEHVARRLMDYGFHSPTVAWPLPGALMIEPTESENKETLQKLADTLVAIAKEIEDVKSGVTPLKESALYRAPHTMLDLIECCNTTNPKLVKAIFPFGEVSAKDKFWPGSNKSNAAGCDRALLKSA